MKIDPQGVYGPAETLLYTASTSGAALTRALDAISPDAVRAACGGDEIGKETYEGFTARAKGLIGAGKSLDDSLSSIALDIASVARLLEQLDEQHAETLKAVDIGLQTNGRLPGEAAPPAPGS
jgi:hypothetical protein